MCLDTLFLSFLREQLPHFFTNLFQYFLKKKLSVLSFMYEPPPVFSYRARWVALERVQLHRKSQKF